MTGLGLVAVVVTVAVIMTLSTEGTSSTATPMSIAVLPFTNLGAAAEFEPFTEGLTIEVADRLGELSGFRVKPASLAKAAVGDFKADLRAIGKRLGVVSLLMGDVRPVKRSRGAAEHPAV